MSCAKRLEKFFHSRSAHDFPLNVKILAEATPGSPALAVCFFLLPEVVESWLLSRWKMWRVTVWRTTSPFALPRDEPLLATRQHIQAHLSVFDCVSISQMSDHIPLVRLQNSFSSISNDIRLISLNVYVSFRIKFAVHALQNVEEKIVLKLFINCFVPVNTSKWEIYTSPYFAAWNFAWRSLRSKTVMIPSRKLTAPNYHSTLSTVKPQVQQKVKIDFIFLVVQSSGKKNLRMHSAWNAKVKPKRL